MPPPRRSRLSETDRAEWASYVRNVATLPGRVRPDSPPQPQPHPPIAVVMVGTVTKTEVPARRSSPGGLVIGVQPPGVDNATWNRFRTGKIVVSRTLDLHGRTAQRAFHSLTSLLYRAHADKFRCIEVITGRGSGEGGGVLWRELPLWLNLPDLRPLVLAAAHPHTANTGAVRILLRRVR